jgi:hypothetical protein
LIAPFNGVLIYSFAAMFNFTEGPVFVKGRDDGLAIAVENNAIRSIGWASRRASAMEFRRGNTFPAFFRFSSPGASHRNEAAWPLRPAGKYSCAIPRGGASRLSPCAALKIMERFA